MAAYSLSAIQGELKFLQAAVPIETAINEDTNLNDEQRDKLAFIERARDYARDVVGLKTGGSYQKFVDLQGKPLAWNLSASRKDHFEPYIWTVPLVGPLPYLGFFELKDAQSERDRLVGLGYDTVTYEVDAFSTLGLFSDPVASSILRRDLTSLADTIMHESLHNTVYRRGDTNFNESLATFVGRTAGLQFLAHEYGADAAIIQQANDSYEDSDRFNAFMQSLVKDLNVLYESDRSSDEKIAGREDVIQAGRDRFTKDVLPLIHRADAYQKIISAKLNNAFLLLHVRYNTDLDVFERVYEKNGRDWATTLDQFTQAAKSDDPIAFLTDLAPPSP